jgi:anthranilate synthase/aminodeoxychorismate synthase-like glutamine amidotransferase
MILFIDNYDSFTYNLVDYFGQYEPALVIKRNDKISLDDIGALNPDGIVLSPGPGNPDNAGICNDVIRSFYKTKHILGVCLGHQCIGAVFGSKIIRAPEPVHGKTAEIFHNNAEIFRTLPAPFQATRYHSLIIDRKSITEELEITAETKDGLIMGIKHKKYPLSGLQFHPESILTTEGKTIIKNWLEDISSSKFQVKFRK